MLPTQQAVGTLALVLVLVVACSPTDVCGCEPPAVHIFVSGVVHDAGTAVPQAVLSDIHTAGFSCAVAGNTYSGRQDVTASSSGEFSFQIEHPGPSDTCLRFSVLSSAGVELLEVAELLLLRGVIEITVELSLDVSNPAFGGAP
jgi:hypothetical protein